MARWGKVRGNALQRSRGREGAARKRRFEGSGMGGEALSGLLSAVCLEPSAQDWNLTLTTW